MLNTKHLKGNRGPLQPAAVMQTTGRYYVVEVYNTNRRTKAKEVVWSPDKDSHRLVNGWNRVESMKTTLRTAMVGEC